MSNRFNQKINRIRRYVGLASAGQVDIGLASATTFVVQVFAVREFDAASLGAYAFLFQAFVLASQVPTYLVFNPIEIFSLELPETRRLAFRSKSITRGTWIAIASSPLVALGVIPSIGILTTRELAMMALAAAAACVTSPVQDHIRRLLHLANRSWKAVIVSAAHLVVTAGILLQIEGAMGVAGPFVALVGGNVLSYTVAVAISRSRPEDREANVDWRDVTSMGKWMTLTGVSTAAFEYLAIVILKGLAGIVAVGHVEAARVLTRPVAVAAQGALAVTGPRLMESSSRGDRAKATRWRRVFWAIALAFALVYGALALVPFAWSPLRILLPTAYSVSFLPAAMLLASLANSALFALRAELFGAREQRAVFQTVSVAGAVAATATTSAYLVGPFGSVLGLMAGSLTSAIGFRRALARVYSDVRRR